MTFFLECVSYLLFLVPVLVGVALVTLYERKILGLLQLRVGPNQVGPTGLLQPFSDVMKLFSKNKVSPAISVSMLMILIPGASVFLMMLLWCLSPMSGSLHFSKVGVVFLLVIFSIGSYPVLVMGWVSNSKYGYIGSMRSVAQSISYEISLALLLGVFVVVASSLSILKISSVMGVSFFLTLSPLLFLWLICMLAETHRTPFDFTEGESELVSGFNVEYGAHPFALIFMAEYGSIYFISVLTSSFFFCCSVLSLSLVSSLVIFWWIWTRGTLPRFRYDMLMNMSWKTVLPLSLGFFFVSGALMLI